MWMLLQRTREDVDKQFDENQGSWTPLKEYTVEKKAGYGGDPRILHDTREGQGLRLRDAYMEAGSVDPYGKLTYTYPQEKPYAIEHQEGRGETLSLEGDKEKPKKKGRKKLTWAERRQKEWARLDDELDDRFRRKF
jgi:hypothetical protein